MRLTKKLYYNILDQGEDTRKDLTFAWQKLFICILSVFWYYFQYYAFENTCNSITVWKAQVYLRRTDSWKKTHDYLTLLNWKMNLRPWFWVKIIRDLHISKSNRPHTVEHIKYILQIPLKWWTICPKSWIWTSCFSSSSDPSVTRDLSVPMQGLNCWTNTQMLSPSSKDPHSNA